MHPQDDLIKSTFVPSVVLDADGIICIDFTDCTRITLSIVESVYAQHRRLCPDRRSPVMMVGRWVGRVDHPAQRFAASPEVAAQTLAMAFVVSSFLQRHLARMFLMYQRPPFAVQVFTDGVAARRWLLSQHAISP